MKYSGICIRNCCRIAENRRKDFSLIDYTQSQNEWMLVELFFSFRFDSFFFLFRLYKLIIFMNHNILLYIYTKQSKTFRLEFLSLLICVYIKQRTEQLRLKCENKEYIQNQSMRSSRISLIPNHKWKMNELFIQLNGMRIVWIGSL